jgi:uncharacterized membrane protein
LRAPWSKPRRAELHSADVVGTYGAAVITKDADGKVKVHKHEKPTQHDAWIGVLVGAVVGILFPPALLRDVAIGGLAGGGEARGVSPASRAGAARRRRPRRRRSHIRRP